MSPFKDNWSGPKTKGMFGWCLDGFHDSCPYDQPTVTCTCSCHGDQNANA